MTGPDTDRDAAGNGTSEGPGDRDASDDETADGAADRRDAADETAGGATAWDAVFWDIGGVILDVDSVRAGHYRFLTHLVDEIDADVEVDEAVETWRATVGRHFREREGTEFRSAREAYGRAVAEIAGEAVPESTWLPLFRETATAALEANGGAREALAELAAMDVHLGVVSDADREEAERILEAFGVRDRFDSLTISEDVGRTKPDPAMFEAALEASGADPERSIMIGDRYEHDMAGATRFGMTTVAHGAGDGEAVDHHVDDLREVVEIVRGRQ